jgi:signal transduction histidine kinase/CheY-like chemotaxis protein
VGVGIVGAVFVVIAVVVVALVTVRLGSHPGARPLLLGWVPTAVALVAITAWWGERAAEREKGNLRSLVQGMAPTYAVELERLGHAELPLDAPPDDPRYLRLLDAQVRWLAANPAIADIYTMRLRPDGEVVLVVDAETDYDRDGVIRGDREERTALGEVYPAEDVSDALRAAFDGRPTFTDEVVVDRWGAWVSANVPLRDGAGAVEAVVGVDFPAASWLSQIERARDDRFALGLLLLLFAAGVFLAVGQVPRERERRRTDVAKLEDAVRAAEAATTARTDLLHTVSHEIRNPLNGVIGMSEMLLETHLDADQRHCAETVHRSGQLLLQTLDGVLDFAKIEADAVDFEAVSTDVRELAAVVVTLFSEAARRKRLELYAHVDVEVPDRVRTDPTRLRQVLVNLVANAVKFTSAGEVELHVSSDPRGLVLRVRDTGIGIPAEKVPRLFTPFHQVDGAATTRRFGGTGLGLFISKGLVEGMGGALTVASEPGRGATFTVTLPAEIAPSDPERRRQHRDRTVLIVDPHRGAAEALAALVGSTGARALAASDLRAAERAVVEESPAVVFADADLLDDHPSSLVFKKRRVVCVTGSPLSGRSGPVLRKPTTILDVRRILMDLFEDAPSRRERTAVPIVVLVVEANPVNQSVVPALLRAFGCGVDLAGTVPEALAALQRAPVDLVLVGTGLESDAVREVIAAVRRSAPRDHLPVLTVGAVDGADEVVGWPLRADTVEQLLRRWIPGVFGADR